MHSLNTLTIKCGDEELNVPEPFAAWLLSVLRKNEAARPSTPDTLLRSEVVGYLDDQMKKNDKLLQGRIGNRGILSGAVHAYWIAADHFRQSPSIQSDGATGWRDIATAPRDGTVFLALYSQDFSEKDLLGENQGWLGLPRYPFLCKWDAEYYPDELPEEAGEFVECDQIGKGDMDCSPKYWMLFPSLPKQIARRKLAMQNELKNCPFCDGAACYEKDDSGEWVECSDCGARGDHAHWGANGRHVDEWNARCVQSEEASINGLLHALKWFVSYFIPIGFVERHYYQKAVDAIGRAEQQTNKEGSHAG